MNREFIMKLMQAKKLEYEAFKEILPERIGNKIGDLEKELMDIAKECVMSGFTDCGTGKREPGKPEENKVKRVNID